MQPATAWISDIRQSGLSQVARYYLWRGLALATRRNYNTPRSRFTIFCELSGYRHQNGGCFLAKAPWLIEWVCSLAGTVNIKIMKLYLTGIKSYQLDLGISCTTFADHRLEHTIQGIKRDHNEPQRRMRTPLTRPCLKLIIQHLSPSNYNDAATRGAFTLAFTGFLRVGKFTYKESDRERGPAFGIWFIMKTSIRIRVRGSFMELTVPSYSSIFFLQSSLFFNLLIASKLYINCIQISHI